MEWIPGDPGKSLLRRQTAVRDETVGPQVRDHDLQDVALFAE